MDKFIIPDTMAACAVGKQTAEQAVQDAEREMKRIYQRHAEGWGWRRVVAPSLPWERGER